MADRVTQPILTFAEFFIYAIPIAVGLTLSTLRLPHMMSALGIIMIIFGVMAFLARSDESQTMFLVSLFPLGAGVLAFVAGLILRLAL